MTKYLGNSSFTVTWPCKKFIMPLGPVSPSHKVLETYADSYVTLSRASDCAFAS
jgi:hypothetical protein